MYSNHVYTETQSPALFSIITLAVCSHPQCSYMLKSHIHSCLWAPMSGWPVSNHGTKIDDVGNGVQPSSRPLITHLRTISGYTVPVLTKLCMSS